MRVEPETGYTDPILGFKLSGQLSWSEELGVQDPRALGESIWERAVDRILKETDAQPGQLRTGHSFPRPPLGQYPLLF
ncbi:hypothetical protein [Pseudarthrobacter chlorophenolicus]|uniref:hypothetical protein n=1 Tax=Pseudarthrobacter chlorophenolicus TaxID=85085 RepID=UPI001269A172|nr:hypothetical protein [Pseudarthrobacter chlorophenolicus]